MTRCPYSRAYVLSDVPKAVCEALTVILQAQGLSAGLEGLFWLPVPDALLEGLPAEHCHTCGPYRMALDIQGTQTCEIRLEWLLRATTGLSCLCVSYGSETLERAMMATVDALLAQADGRVRDGDTKRNPE